MYYIETLLGEGMMQSLLRLYLSTFEQTAITSTDFKALYESFVETNFNVSAAADILNATDWDTWTTTPGLPPVTLDFSTSELNESLSLANSYVELGGETSPDSYASFFEFFTAQKTAFVQQLASIDAVDSALLAFIDADLNLTNSVNPLVKKEWFSLGIRKGYDTVYNPAYDWVGEQGRNAYTRAIFKALVDADMCVNATEWLDDRRDFYNSYVVNSVEIIIAECAEPGPSAPPAGSVDTLSPSPPTKPPSNAVIAAANSILWIAATTLGVLQM